MTRWTNPQFRSRSRPVSVSVASAIKRFSSSRRNIIRGAVTAARRGSLTTDAINVIRANVTEGDMVAAATILETPNGLRKRGVFRLMQADIAVAHHLQARSASLEIAYACGFLNGWKQESVMAIDTIALLSRLTEVSVTDAIGAVSKAADTWGASNYIALKLAYMREFFELGDDDERGLNAIDVVLGHAQAPMIQYSALENIKTKISLFSIARRHTNILMEHVKGDFRRFHTLNNLLPTPISHDDCAGFALRGTESSLIDAARCLVIIANLKERLPEAFSAIERNLDPEILQSLLSAQERIAAVPQPQLVGSAEGNMPDDEHSAFDDERSLLFYRRSVVFLEFQTLCKFRQDIDRVVGHRLIAPVLGEVTRWNAESFGSLRTLKQPDGVFELSQHGTADVQIDGFYRTYLFLRFIQVPTNLALLSSDEVKYIFDSTMRLEALLLEHELKTMHLNASEEARALISVLALSLYRGKSSDPDVDFDFRANLEDYIIRNFGGSISDFIESLAPKSPQVANYIASSLDEVTLQKMYQIVSSPLEADNARRDILTSVGVHLNKIEYIIAAEAIETRSKVAKLRSYFDTSRMFVDSIAMRKWLGSNPSAYTEQYKEMFPKLTARLAASKSIVSSSGKEATIDIVELTSTDDYLVERMAADAFKEFCVNNEFGIESYLGRRIRHNTLQGVMTKSVDAVLQRLEYNPIIAGTPFGSALRAWESSYKVYVERMRREFLQFRSASNPKALFNSEIDFTEAITKRNLQQLIQTLRLSGPEMLDELIIGFCWRQIAPQLDTASRQIRVKMTQEITQTLDQALQRFNGPEELKVKLALENGVTSVLAQVASWFQVPQTGFVPATISEICNIVDIEYDRSSPTIVSGDDSQTSYYGISVHRLYDCLAVLLQNAFKHGSDGSDVTVKMSSKPILGTNLHTLDVAVQSIMPKADAARCTERVSSALSSTETGKDMVTEGYSGIKKVKFITRLNEGKSTVAFDVLDDIIEVRFQLKVEVADEGGED